MSGTPGSLTSESAQSAKALGSTRRKQPTQERVRELFDYREDGCLIRRTRQSNCVCLGGPAGGLCGRGYLRIMVDGVHLRVHRLIWLWHHGYMPESGIDHINRDKLDNRIENLREVSQVCNLRNTGNSKNNTSGVKGVSWTRTGCKWSAELVSEGTRLRLGQYADFAEAVAHRLAAEQCLNWEGCDSCSPAYQYMKEYLKRTISSTTRL